jgi:hypothetical protein
LHNLAEKPALVICSNVTLAILNAVQWIVKLVIGVLGVIGLLPAVFKFALDPAQFCNNLPVVVFIVHHFSNTTHKPLAVPLIALLKGGVLGPFVPLVFMMEKLPDLKHASVQFLFNLLAVAETAHMMIN